MFARARLERRVSRYHAIYVRPELACDTSTLLPSLPKLQRLLNAVRIVYHFLFQSYSVVRCVRILGDQSQLIRGTIDQRILIQSKNTIARA